MIRDNGKEGSELFDVLEKQGVQDDDNDTGEVVQEDSNFGALKEYIDT